MRSPQGDDLFQRAHAARQCQETVRQCGHFGFALVHRGDDVLFREALMPDFQANEMIGDHSHRAAACCQYRIRHHTHQADIPSAIHEGEAAFRNQRSRFPRRLHKRRVIPRTRTAIDAYGLNSGFGYGVVFRISPSGSFSNLWAFSQSDGAYPDAGLVQGSDGYFYGTTGFGGMYSNGTIFRISTSGSLTVLQSITTGGNGGGSGANGLMQGNDGNFYGTTTQGGTSSNGSIFRLSVPLSPPANQISAIQMSGTNLVLTIPSIASETYQLQFSSSMNSTNRVNVPGASVSNSIGSLLTLTNIGGALQPQGFYRFDITP